MSAYTERPEGRLLVAQAPRFGKTLAAQAVHSRGTEAPHADPMLISAEEAAAKLGIAVTTVREMARRSQIPHTRIGRRVLFPVRELERWVDRNTHGASDND